MDDDAVLLKEGKLADAVLGGLLVFWCEVVSCSPASVFVDGMTKPTAPTLPAARSAALLRASASPARSSPAAVDDVFFPMFSEVSASPSVSV